MIEKASWSLIGMTLDEAAEALRVDSKTLRALIKQGDFPARKVGKGYRIDPEAVKRWLAEKPAKAEAEDEE
jgi:excisionase family DNA binding protein